jgi:hypothetical protein
MTAIPERRRRRTLVAAVTATGLLVAAGAMFVVGVVTLANSEEGEAVGVDDRPREVFPATPNALVSVTDDDGNLASVAVMTLLPDGAGGSIVTMPVNSDSTAGFGLQRRPLDELFDPELPDDFVMAVEDMLSITIQRSTILDPAGLAAIVEPVGSIDVVLPDDVIDSDAVDPALPDDDPTQGVVVSAGPQTLSPEDVAAVLTAIDETGRAYAQHAIDVAMWSAIAARAPLTVAGESSGSANGAGAPATAEELVVELLSGEVAVRDISATRPGAATNPTEADVVVLDRTDAALVFAQVSPALVSTPNPGLKIRVEAQYTDDQVEQSDGLFDSASDVAREFIGQMLFLQNNVVSADTAAVGAPEVTVIEITDPSRLEETEAAAEALFGEADVRVAEVVLEGVDLRVTLGMTYLIREMVRVGAGTEEAPADPTPATTDTVGGDG